MDKIVQEKTQISWVDFIKANDIEYSADHNYCGRDLTSVDIEQQVSEVKFKVSDNVSPWC